MNKYIFLTNESYTYKLNPESIESDCENTQLIGIESGNLQEDAFKNLINEKECLRQFNFNEIYCYKLVEDYKESERY